MEERPILPAVFDIARASPSASACDAKDLPETEALETPPTGTVAAPPAGAGGAASSCFATVLPVVSVDADAEMSFVDDYKRRRREEREEDDEYIAAQALSSASAAPAAVPPPSRMGPFPDEHAAMVESEIRRNTPYGQAASLTLLAARIAQDVIEFALRDANVKDEAWFQIENFQSMPGPGAEPGTRLKGFEFKLRCVLLEQAPKPQQGGGGVCESKHAEPEPERDVAVARMMDPEGAALKEALQTVLKKQRKAARGEEE